MARIFISHSSKNNPAAIALSDWIIAGGWDENPFLDLDPERGIAAGERWERALYEAENRCEVVLFLVSRQWLESEWCLKEFHLAQKLNKRLFSVLIDDLSRSDLPSELSSTWQTVNLASGNDHDMFRVNLPDLSKEEHVTFSRSGLSSLKAGLNKSGLNPCFFAWPPEDDPNRSPYPGFRPLEAEDAGIFFGRDASIINAIDRLRGLRERGAPRILVILGASGAGKSSFLRAGLIPRLRRDEANYLILPVIRPSTVAINGINGLINAIVEAFKGQGKPVNRANIEAAIDGGVFKLLPILTQLIANAQTPEISGYTHLFPPTLIISIDQAEELFLTEGATEAQNFLTLLRELTLTSTITVIVLFTIRADSYERLQAAKPLDDLKQEIFPLPPMSRGSYQTIIEGPAQRLKDSKHSLIFDPALTQALLKDIEEGGGKDALPLLAFTLERLYRQYGADGDLLLEEYQTLGGIRGSVQAAVNAAFLAANADPTIPTDPTERLKLLRSALIPALAGIDPVTRTPRRRVARISEIPQQAHSLIHCLVEARLLTTDRIPDTGETIIEPAHEAFLRQWDELQGWLEEDSASLLSLASVQQAARDWNVRDQNPDWLSHDSGRLEDAEHLLGRQDFARLITPIERAYLHACRVLHDERRNRELEEAKVLALTQKKVAHRTRMGLIVASILLVVASGAAYFAFQQADEAKQQTEKAEQRSVMLATSAVQSLIAEGDLDAALLLLIDGSRWFNNTTSADESRLRLALTDTLLETSKVKRNKLFPNMQVFETDSALLLVNPVTYDIFKLTDSIFPPRLVEGTPIESSIDDMQQSKEGGDVIVLRKNLEVERINLITGERHKVGVFPPPQSLPGRVYSEYDRAKITENGLVVRSFSFDQPEGDSESLARRYIQIMDTYSGQIVEGEEPFDVSAYERAPDGSIHAFKIGHGEGLPKKPDEMRTFMVKQIENKLLFKPVPMNKRKFISLLLGDCVGEMRDALQAKVIKEFYFDYPSVMHPVSCNKVGNQYLFWEQSGGSGGLFEEYTLLEPNKGDFEDVKEIFSQASERIQSLTDPDSDPDFADFTRVNIDSKTGAIAVLLNRDVMVLKNSKLALDYRHPNTPTIARFAGPDHLIVVESDEGQLVEHNWGNVSNKNEWLFSTSTKTIIEDENREKPVNTLHHGTCVGNDIPRENYDVMPDGRNIEIVYENSDMDDDSVKNEIRVLGGQEPIILNLEGVRTEYGCVQFSENWKEMLIVEIEGVSIYDLERVLASASLEAGKIGRLPSASIVSSAFFVPNTGEIVTSDGSSRVLIWKREMNQTSWQSTVLHFGENPIHYAEPDANGGNLILLENPTAGSTIHGLLYSVSARQKWFDLGEEYKWLGAAFNDKQEVVVAHNTRWTDVFPMLPLNRLVELAKKELSTWCHPKIEGDYRSSPCWPSSFE